MLTIHVFLFVPFDWDPVSHISRNYGIFSLPGSSKPTLGDGVSLPHYTFGKKKQCRTTTRTTTMKRKNKDRYEIRE